MIFHLLVDFGIEGGFGWSVWVATSALAGLSDTSNPSCLSNLSASVAATVGLEASVVAGGGGSSSPSDSHSARNFNSFFFQSGFCNNSANLLRISTLWDAAATAVTGPTGGSFNACLHFAPGGSSIPLLIGCAAVAEAF